MPDRYSPLPPLTPEQIVLATRHWLPAVDLYDFKKPNRAYGEFTPVDFAQLPATEADIARMISTYGNIASQGPQRGLNDDDAEVDWSRFMDFSDEDAQTQPQTERDAGMAGNQQNESSIAQPKPRFEKKQRRRGVRVFTDEQLDIIQGLIEDDTSTKPSLVYRILKEIDPSMERPLTKVNAAVKDARRQKGNREAGIYDGSLNG